MSNRTTSIRKGDGTTLLGLTFECGGSPISPIIAMLYFSQILRLGDQHMRFGYADDIAIFTRGKTTRETTTLTQGVRRDTRMGNGKCNLLRL